MDRSAARKLVLERAAREPQYGGTGYGEVFDEMMAAAKDGELAPVLVAGVTYYAITDAGRAALHIGHAEAAE